VTAKALYELHFGDAIAFVEFLLTAANEWVAQVQIGDFKTLIRKEMSGVGRFHPCCVHAERLYFVALGMVNSGRQA